MNTKHAIPVLLAAALAVGSGTLLAVAQDSGAAGTAAEMKETREDARRHRGERHGKWHGHRGRHHGRRGMGRAMMRDVFEQVDADGDGRVTRAEIDAWRTAQVARADTGGDGALSLEEFDALYRQFTRTRMVRAFQRIDRDGDGLIDASEIERRLERMIERMDRDGDGVLTPGRDRRG